ncbi:hypothetical protein Sbal175_4438 (plasmid) [Shewanella baltica BA175]|uniref:DUF3800 domain-containing protein n=1 Tax=Shewanella baltica TaxID=62322 RepID=UPI0001E4E192|nr:DUF3800 domain-containing protein [Shewanella baltica]AEG13647.1 hypothetical protein Sbal175_4438 [Shewanella baltica BA175]
MFFHIDESGNTGNNLFDENQPRLSYGVISSTTNVDVLCKKEYKAIQRIIDDDLIHANVLGVKGLVEIAPLLIKIQKKIKFDFDYYFIEKLDYALVIFFDSVFDAGLNEAVKWDSYWTPLRYVLIHNLSSLFDEDLLREAWKLSIAKRIEKYENDIVTLLSEVKSRAKVSSLDERSKELIIDALNFGISKPLALDFGHPDQKIISPNAVGFQFVVASIARRTRKKGRKSISSIVVDRQHQFNKAQISTHYNLSRLSLGLNKSSAKERQMYLNNPLYTNFSPEEITHKGLTDRELTISKSADSIGLQIVDVYLWISNKVISGVQLPPDLLELWSLFGHRSLIDGISLKGMAERYQNFESNLPKIEDLTDEQIQLARKLVEKHREKVKSLT